MRVSATFIPAKVGIQCRKETEEWTPASAGVKREGAGVREEREKKIDIPAKAGIQSSQNRYMYYVYILTNKRNGTLYVGSTNDLRKRIWQHKNKAVDGFTKKYGINKLMYYESAETQEAAAYRERQIKKWNRAWKIRLIEEKNPEWKDLYEEINQ